MISIDKNETKKKTKSNNEPTAKDHNKHAILKKYASATRNVLNSMAYILIKFIQEEKKKFMNNINNQLQYKKKTNNKIHNEVDYNEDFRKVYGDRIECVPNQKRITNFPLKHTIQIDSGKYDAD